MKEYIAEYIIPVEKKGNDCRFDFKNTKPLIRCKDCKYRITANCERFGIKRYTQSDSFCSWAEPKGDKDDR